MKFPLKTIWCIFWVELFSISVSAQDYDYDELFQKHSKVSKSSKERSGFSSEDKPFLLFNINAAIPIGDYGSSNPFDENPSFAKAGFDVNVNAGFPVYDFIYSYSTFGYFKNRPSIEPLREFYSLIFQANGIDLIDLEYNGYNHVYLVTGFAVSGGVEFISFDLRLQLGLSAGIDSEQGLVLKDGAYTVNAVSERAVAFAVMPSVGASVKVKLKEKLLLAVNFDYRHANYQFTDVETIVGNQSAVTDYEVKTDVISVGAGVGITF